MFTKPTLSYSKTNANQNRGFSSFAQTTFGFSAWFNLANIAADDDVRATTASLNGNQITETIQSSNAGFTIPEAATILGIRVTVFGSMTGNNDSMTEDVVLKKHGGASSAARSNGTNWEAFGGSDFGYQYGGPADLWGTTWTPADINGPNFEADFRVTSVINAVNAVFRIDYIDVVVYYEV